MTNPVRQIRLHEEDFLVHQWQFLNDWSRTLGLIGGIGAGKTVPFLYKALLCLLCRPGNNGKANVGIGYPTKELGKSLFFYPFLEVLDSAKINATYTVSPSPIIRTPYGDVNIKSMQHPERIVGDTYTDSGCDELDTLPKPKGMVIVRKFRERNRGRKDSQFFTTSTPEGYSTCYEILKQNPNPNTRLIQAKTTDNKFLSKGFIDDLRATYDKAMLNAYINGEFTNLNSMQAHYAFNRDVHVHEVPAPDPSMTVMAGVDFNVDPLTSAICYSKEIDGIVHYFFYDEYYLRNSNTYMLSDLLAQDYAGKRVVCYPDPTGESRKTSADMSDVEILNRKGFETFYTHGITQRRSLNYANGAFDHNRIHISPKCKYLIADLEQVVTDQYGQIEKPKGTLLTHISDAMRNIITIDTISRNQPQGNRI